MADSETDTQTTRLRLCTTDEVPPGEGLKVEIDGLTLAVFNMDGTFQVTDDACTHGPGSLSEGYLEGDVIECNFHQGAFNVCTGEPVRPPCFEPLRTYKTIVEDGVVYIER